MNESERREAMRRGPLHGPDLTLNMRSDPRFLTGARGLIASVAEKIGLSSTSCAQVALAIDEALCNVIRHGYKKRSDAPIWVMVWVLADEGVGAGLRIVIEDEAEQVDPSKIRGRDLADVRPGGLGVHIIREVMDVAEYEMRSPVGMRLTLVKYDRPSPGVEPAAVGA
ncbi:MAG: ATP-binding protein [Phycisphaeraceae bacterium]|nr:ATP-binding protein [Phycisphaerae bacterium]MBX3391792.1 ATP-binding protein [Phycisphaeraceae bacterium]HRJ50542.1 ATP-binding protein [Phycisphaerales bacterium]